MRHRLTYVFIGCLTASMFPGCESRPASPPVSVESQTNDVAPASPAAELPEAAKNPPPQAEPPQENVTFTSIYGEGPNELTSEQVADGWIRLFDGQTLFGWESGASSVDWHVEDGTVVASAGGPGLLVTTSPFVDYELLCDFQISAGGNSGIFLRTSPDCGDPTSECYELNICDSHPQFKTGSLVGRQTPETFLPGEEEWRTFAVRVSGAEISVTLDGESVLEYADPEGNSLPSGRIGLQQNEGRIAFRNIFLKPLGTTPILPQQDLDGWRIVPGSLSKFTNDNGEIHVVGGRGFLESSGTYGDFLLQAQVKTNGEALNSGIFFRTMPGTEDHPSDGYEFQINHGLVDGDRRQPLDFGTGAIMHRQKVRWVNADDGEWTSLTLVADDAHFASWVNGLQVMDWTDTREPDENPRRGLRTEPGHLSLQGHDETTDLQFRNLVISDLP